VEAHHWSLREIDLTDIESLIPFLFYQPGEKVQKTYCDEVDFL
jgi:hypothetical protein